MRVVRVVMANALSRSASMAHDSTTSPMTRQHQAPEASETHGPGSALNEIANAVVAVTHGECPGLAQEQQP